MSYLENKLSYNQKVITPPAKEGGIAALSGVKVPEFIAYNIYTVPLYHHSFNLLKKAVKNQGYVIINRIKDRCKKQCTVDLEMLHGKNTHSLDLLSQCQSDLMTEITGPYYSNTEVKLI